ncbi:MAG: prepilin-type N-terminal cleavage/methylation domain-containing protein [Patescibacteria group bacterium]
MIISGHKKKSGFTLIELIIAIAIFAMLTSWLFLTFKDTADGREVKNDAAQLLDGIRQMQTMALSGQLVNGDVPLKYSFVLDACNSDCSYEQWAVFNNSSTSLAVYHFKKLIITGINSKDGSGNVTSLSSVGLSFLPPRGNPIFSVASSTEVNISVKHSVSDISYCLKINRISGRMDIKSAACP